MPDSILGRFRNSAVAGYRSMLEGIVAVISFLLSAGPSGLFWSVIIFFIIKFTWKILRRSKS
jgi:hypothetical protein